MTEEKKYKLDQVSVRLKLCEETPLYSTEQINSPRRAIEVMKGMIRQLDREYVCIVNLDNGNRPINFNIVSIGSINVSIVTMRELLKSSILSNASSLIMLHSHPSYRLEKPEPSPEDHLTTLNVMIATDLLGIKLQDHVIVSGGIGTTYSYRTELKDKFSIEGLRDIVESQNNKSVLLSESRLDYKPLDKVEELEEQNYNQIDNVLNNTKPGKAVKPEDRPSVIERMKAGKKELDARNAAKAQEPHELNTEKAK